MTYKIVALSVHSVEKRFIVYEIFFQIRFIRRHKREKKAEESWRGKLLRKKSDSCGNYLRVKTVIFVYNVTSKNTLIMHLIWLTRPSIEDLVKKIIVVCNFEVKPGDAYG